MGEAREPKRGRRVRRVLPLRDDESLLVEVSPSRLATCYKYLYTLGLYGIWRKRNSSVITSDRVLTGRGVFRREETSIPMSRVVDVKYVRRGLHCYAEMAILDRGHHRTEDVGPLSPRIARKVAAAILDRL
jgi:hypothetical protein